MRRRTEVPGTAWPGPDAIRGCQVVRDVDVGRYREVCIGPLGHEVRTPAWWDSTWPEVAGRVECCAPELLEGHTWAPLHLVGLVEDAELAAHYRDDAAFRERAGWDVPPTWDRQGPTRVRVVVPGGIYRRRCPTPGQRLLVNRAETMALEVVTTDGRHRGRVL